MTKFRALVEKIEDHELLLEDNAFGEKSLYVKGPFIVMDKKNVNRRVYRSDRTIPIVDQYITERVQRNRSVGELDHPTAPEEIPVIHMNNVSHRIVELVRTSNVYEGRALVLDTPQGKLIQALHKGGVVFGASSRALGSVDGQGFVNPGMRLVTPADLVFDPSAVDAIMQGLYESAAYTTDYFGEDTAEQLRTKILGSGALEYVKRLIEKRVRT